MTEEADFVLIGTAIQSIHGEPITERYLNEEGYGTDVLVEVKKVIKGELGSDTVFVSQYFEDSCSKTFYLGKEYMIFGYHIKEYKLMTEEEVTEAGSRGYTEEANELKVTSQLFFDFEFHNDLVSRYTTLRTNDCRTFGTKTAKYKRLFE